MEYDILRPWLTLDPWQKEYIAEKGNCFVLCGRQSGKSAAASIKFGERAAKNANHVVLMIALTEKQAYNLFFKTLMYLEAKYPYLIKRGVDKPTKHLINLKNGSQIMCYAAGLTGEGIRTYTVNSLVIDEAAPMAREVFIATLPMLSVTDGTFDIISTPRGKEGFFYECSDKCPIIKPNIKRFYVSAEDCPRHSKEFLKQQREAMSQLEYAQEYQAKFLDEVRQVFSDELIKSCMTLERRPEILKERRYYLGVDIAGMGEDENTFEIIDKLDNGNLEHIENMTTKKQYTTETTDQIIALDNIYGFSKIYIDDGGLGFGVLSELLKDPRTRSKTIGINNARRVYQRDSTGKEIKERTKILMKEELYENMRILMERGKIKLLKDSEIFISLKSVQYEIIKGGGVRYFGSYTHICEGLVRAAWCAKDKTLNSWVVFK